jgi:uncharacterized protein YndB with AHSA1/START domain
MNQATLITEGTRPAVRLERQLPDPPEVVWRAVTEREQLRAWFPCDVVVDGGCWEPGAAINYHFPPEVIDMTLTGRVLEVEEGKLLVFTWGEEVLSFELSPDGSGTRFVLVDELPASHAARNAAGWDECLDRLAGVGGDDPGWQARFERYRGAFEPSLGPQDGPPAGYKGE